MANGNASVIELGDEMLDAAAVAKLVGTSRPTVYHWYKVGCFGVKLEHVAVGSRLKTTRAAVEKFMAEVKAARQNGIAHLVAATDKSRAARIERANKLAEAALA